MTTPRILCLHGGGSNDDITQFQTGGLRLTHRAECLFLNAPHVVNYCYPGLSKFSKGPWRVWAPTKGMMFSNHQDQWDESLEYIAKFCEENGPFDGVYGFSQGTAIITNFSHPSIWKDRFQMKQCPWKFAILACGGASFQVNIAKGDAPCINMPSFHIFGRRDMHFNDSNAIAEYWDPSQKMTHTHARGHEIDLLMWTRETELINKLNHFLDEQLPSEKYSAVGGDEKKEEAEEEGVLTEQDEGSYSGSSL